MASGEAPFPGRSMEVHDSTSGAVQVVAGQLPEDGANTYRAADGTGVASCVSPETAGTYRGPVGRPMRVGRSRSDGATRGAEGGVWVEAAPTACGGEARRNRGRCEW